ncbi:MAG: PcfJ domain-containing protein [Armatimonas sp.]
MRTREKNRQIPGAQEHLRELGFTCLKDYQVWCAEKGLRTGLRKGTKEKARELALRNAPIAEASASALPDPDKGTSKLYDLLLQFAHSRHVKHGALHPNLQGLRPLFLKAKRQPGAPEALALLLCMVQKHLRAKGIHQAGFDPVLANGLLMLVLRRHWWLRPVNEWKPEGTTSRGLFFELSRHLLARYPVPAFFDASWLGHEDESFQCAFRTVGLGQNLTRARLPLPISKRIAHLVMTEAPGELRTLLAAIRWAQARAIGGYAELAQQVAVSKLGEKVRDETFVSELISWLVRNEEGLRVAQVGPLIDYLLFERETPHTDNTMQRLPKGFTFKGRTIASVTEHMQAWHEWLRWRTRFEVDEWAGCGVRGWVGGTPEDRWEVREITEALELVAEGAAMKHCVASYGAQCIRGDVSIWSVRQETSEGWQRVLTVRLTRQRVIVEARGWCNASPRHSHSNELLQQGAEVLKRWAGTRNLQIESGVL